MEQPRIVNLPAEYSVDRHGALVVAIIAHGTAGTDSREYLRTGGGRGVSIHVLIQRDGTIYRMVPDERGANHAGAPTSSFMLNGKAYAGAAVNAVTLSFELENRQDGRELYTREQLAAMGWQITQWRQKYGMLPILRHAELDPTRRRDPYQLPTSEMERWAALTPPPVSLPSAYRAVVCAPVFEDRRPDARIALTIAPMMVREMDDLMAGWLHLADGSGFSPVSCWERTQ